MSKAHLYFLISIGGCVVLALLYFINPIDYIWMPKCPTKILFGINCPGCGFQRAVHALLHGHIKEAIGYNLFFVVAFPYLIAVLSCSIMSDGKLRQRIKKNVESRWLTHGYVILFFIWFVARNIFKL